MPHELMPGDAMTKADVNKGSDALNHLLRTGEFCLILEGEELKRRATGGPRE